MIIDNHFVLDYYRLKGPILHSLWGSLRGFTFITSPKPDWIWMKPKKIGGNCLYEILALGGQIVPHMGVLVVRWQILNFGAPIITLK